MQFADLAVILVLPHKRFMRSLCDLAVFKNHDLVGVAYRGDTLCNKKGQNSGDNYHDGDTGGGQFLNACVWFEILTGKSCVDNTFKPSYSLSETKRAALKSAAHQAVEDMKK